MRWFQVPLAIVGAALLVNATSCRAATEITLTIRTNVPCDEVTAWQGIAVYVGRPGAESADQAPTLVTKRCEGDGQIGSLVVVPSGNKDELVGVRVVAGIALNPEDCLANGYKGGCIVARRAIRFTPHTDLSLHVDLSSSCTDVACDPRNTCFAGDCEPALAAPAPAVEQPTPGTPSVRCGDGGVFCSLSGDPCCLTVDVEAGATRGECKPASSCSDIVLRCDDDTDCPDGGPEGAWKGVCVVSYTAAADAPTPFIPASISHSHCLLAVSNVVGGIERPHTLALCEERETCADGAYQCWETSVDTNLLPGYHWCHLAFQQ